MGLSYIARPNWAILYNMIVCTFIDLYLLFSVCLQMIICYRHNVVQMCCAAVLLRAWARV
jgi:hypothetical protein